MLITSHSCHKSHAKCVVTVCPDSFSKASHTKPSWGKWSVLPNMMRQCIDQLAVHMHKMSAHHIRKYDSNVCYKHCKTKHLLRTHMLAAHEDSYLCVYYISSNQFWWQSAHFAKTYESSAYIHKDCQGKDQDIAQPAETPQNFQYENFWAIKFAPISRFS